MEIEPAPLGLLEIESESVQFLLAAEPNETIQARLDVGLEYIFVFAAGDRGGAVGGDYQVVEGCVAIRIGDFGLEQQFHAQTRGALLEYLQKFYPRDAAEAMPARGYFVAFEEDVYIVPV